jgi:2-dehydro-3-deoxy-D-arabinonate dehydratase
MNHDKKAEYENSIHLFASYQLLQYCLKPMRLCRFAIDDQDARVGVVTGQSVIKDLTPLGVTRMGTVLEQDDPAGFLQGLPLDDLPEIEPGRLRLRAPVEGQEIWAAGVTYLRSKVARMEESDFSATAYDKVYDAARPEIFFKCLPAKAAGPGDPVGIRRDATWSVPEPELALVLNSRGRIAGYTIGNDMSSRDIEGENLLYLPQAKIYDRSCAVGPWITLGATEHDARTWTIGIDIRRGASTVFAGETSVGQIKRAFDALAAFLFRSQQFPQGAIMLTGTGVVPPDTFTLQEHDVIDIKISGIGSLTNRVVIV